jgi:hypothetical protein
MAKPDRFGRQAEYRFCFAVDDAFVVHGTRQVITTRERAPGIRAEAYPQDLLVLGSLRRLVNLHHFNIAAA